MASLSGPAQSGRLKSDDVRFLQSVPNGAPGYRSSRLLLLTYHDRAGDKAGHCRVTEEIFNRPEHRHDAEITLEMAKCCQGRKQHQRAVELAEEAMRNIQSMPRQVRYGGTVTLLEILARGYRSLWAESGRNLSTPDERYLEASIRYWEKLQLASKEDWRRSMCEKELADLRRRQEQSL